MKPKNESNRNKHGIDFETASLVFDDPFHVSDQHRMVGTEERWLTIGSVEDIIVLTVVHTYETKPYGSSQHDQPADVRGDCMSKLSQKERDRLRKLAAKPDSEIDFSAIPEVKALSRHATIGQFYRVVRLKKKVTVRLDADVLAWLKSDGEGYQTRINEYLREKMTRSLARRKTV